MSVGSSNSPMDQERGGGKIRVYIPTQVKQMEKGNVLYAYMAPGCQILDLTNFYRSKKAKTSRNLTVSSIPGNKNRTYKVYKMWEEAYIFSSQKEISPSIETTRQKSEAKIAKKFKVKPIISYMATFWGFSHSTNRIQNIATSYAAVTTKGLQKENKDNEIPEIPELEEGNQSKSDEMIAPSPS
ncbi:hypothetical protein CHS0354_017852 [Potamilus streckersoni]|uniref:Uncharacterized protein n=1 Tax=Potamilus streckersoni TaxID=2493646 RepID=A0AAE0T6J1_9BIVA|nr:hypothetical protein CHS0354_017852 [Potamilus streckersoni]